MDEGREISFYNDASHNYMVLECPPGLKDNYQYKMLAANRIKGLLVCSGRTIDNREYLYYDISSRQSLADLYDRRPVRSAELNRILKDLVLVEETLTEYLLDTSHLILEPDCVYLDFREQSCSFVYYPGEEQEKGPEHLFTFLADRVDGRDKQAAALIYRLCMMAEKPGFRLRTGVLEDLGMHIDMEERGDRADRTDRVHRQSYTQEYVPYEHGSSVSGYGQGLQTGYDTYSSAGRGKLPAYTDYSTAGREEERGRMSADQKRNGSYEYRDGNTDRTAEESRRETMKERSRKEGHGRGPGSWIMAGFPAAAGAALLVLDRFLELGERELFLTRAFGGVLAAAGAVLLVIQILHCRGKKGGQEQEREVAPVYTGPEPWEASDYSVSSRADSLREYAPREYVPQVQNPVFDIPADPGPSFHTFAAPGETCLLGPDTGPAAGLYGTGTCRGEQISLTELPCVVGKIREYVDQVVDDSSVSRIHARFSLDREGKMTVRDLNSTNGTWLNGERLQPNESRTLQQGDHLRLGRMEYVFR